MIHEVDDALRTLIRRDALEGSDVEVVFDAPTKEWAGRRNTPTVDVYLFDIREDMKRRQVGVIDKRDPDGTVATRRPAPRFFQLSYLITAWTQRPEDEHRLLSSVLACFLRYDILPDDVLTGSLAELGLPVQVHPALPLGGERQISDVWAAMGGELKPSLDILAIAPMDSARPITVGPPVLETPRVTIGHGETVESRPGRPPRRGIREVEPVAVPEEERVVGAADHPGRILRVRGTSRR